MDHRADRHGNLFVLQVGAVEHLHVDGHLAPVVVDDEHADGAAAGVKGLLESIPKVGLVDDGQGLLDVAGLGHGNNCIWVLMSGINGGRGGSD